MLQESRRSALMVKVKCVVGQGEMLWFLPFWSWTSTFFLALTGPKFSKLSVLVKGKKINPFSPDPCCSSPFSPRHFSLTPQAFFLDLEKLSFRVGNIWRKVVEIKITMFLVKTRYLLICTHYCSKKLVLTWEYL